MGLDSRELLLEEAQGRSLGLGRELEVEQVAEEVFPPGEGLEEELEGG